MFHDDKNPLEPEYTPFSQTLEERFSGFYETGNTQPPKNHGGWVAAVLLACIFLSGLVGGAILMNMEDSRQQKEPEGSELSSLNAAAPDTTEPPVSSKPTQPTIEATGGAEDKVELLISPTPVSVPNIPQEGGLSLQEIYQKVSPSVVAITAAQSSGTSSGSGIIMSDSGYIITNCHVVEGAYALTVTLSEGQEYAAQLVGKDSVSDLAVLWIQAQGLAAAEFGDSDLVQTGDAVVAIGVPMGVELRGTMTDGIISAVNRNLTIQGRDFTLLQTNAALNEGNSGGPLINCYGQVVGITTAKIGDYYSTAGVEGLGFAIPINTAKEVVDQLIETGYVPGRPDLGVKTIVAEFQYRLYYDLPDGLYVTEVDPDSDACAVGIRTGDVIIYINETRITSQDDLNAALSAYSAGDSVDVTIYRRGKQMTASITLQDAGQ